MLLVVATQKAGLLFYSLKETKSQTLSHLVKRIQLESEPGSSPGLAHCASGSSSLALASLGPGIHQLLPARSS